MNYLLRIPILNNERRILNINLFKMGNKILKKYKTNANNSMKNSQYVFNKQKLQIHKNLLTNERKLLSSTLITSDTNYDVFK